jgi:uncharacterized SAM-binding protein YcdF (DUF218 family)
VRPGLPFPRGSLRLLIGIILLLSLGAAVFGYHAASWLKNDDPPIEADAIIVLSGRFERSMHAADLYRAGYAPLVVLTEEAAGASQLEKLGIHLPAPLEIHRKVLQAKGVPAGRIEVLARPVLSTSDEALGIAARFGQPGRRLLIVTSPFHVRRARLIVARALEGRDVTFVVCATPYESFPDDWWHSQDAAREVLLEWAKLAFYLLGGRFSAN